MVRFSCSGSPFPKPASRVICLHAPDRRPTQSWRSFLRNQASAFGQYSKARSRGSARPHVRSYWAKLMRFTPVRGLDHQQPVRNARRISLRSAQRDAPTASARRALRGIVGPSIRPQTQPRSRFTTCRCSHSPSPTAISMAFGESAQMASITCAVNSPCMDALYAHCQAKVV